MSEPDDMTMRGDLLETYRGLLDDLDETHANSVEHARMMGGSGSATVPGRAADAIRRLAGEVSRLMALLDRAGPEEEECPRCRGRGCQCCHERGSVEPRKAGRMREEDERRRSGRPPLATVGGDG